MKNIFLKTVSSPQRYIYINTYSSITVCLASQPLWIVTYMNWFSTGSWLIVTSLAYYNDFWRIMWHWRPVVDKVHRSSTWVKVQIRIIKYYSSKSKSTAFSILLEWKYKSTQFCMYLSKKVLIDRFILQFYIDTLFNFILAHIFIIILPKIPGFFPK